LALACLLSGGAELFGQGADTRIQAGVSVAPNLSVPGATSGVLITVNNQNPSANQQLQADDAFLLQFDLADGQIHSIPSAVLVNSTTLAGSCGTTGSYWAARSSGRSDCKESKVFPGRLAAL
jgi:hypothetical protein